VDSYRECFKMTKNIYLTNSLPPPNSRYLSVWSAAIDNGDEQKLVVGTKMFNALIISSLRLDTRTQP
ncbi:hypothetical protein BCV72DRAFT_180241, partial [Rhizopus microsporus var. microsporus]